MEAALTLESSASTPRLLGALKPQPCLPQSALYSISVMCLNDLQSQHRYIPGEALWVLEGANIQGR